MEVVHTEEQLTHAVLTTNKPIEFKINANAEMMHLLSSNIYNDPLRAVVREVMCNAYDAHIMAGIPDTPIKVWIEDHELHIQDFGYGISPDLIEDIYCTYGSSNKKTLANVTGGLGLGSKSPWAISDYFKVASCFEGTKTIYAMSKSNAEIGGMPSAIPMLQTPCGDTSGLTVIVPLGNWRESQVITHIEQVAYQGSIPTMLGDKALETLKLGESKFLLEWGNKLSGHGNISIRYGNVLYPITVADGFKDELDVVSGIKSHLRATVGDYYSAPHLTLIIVAEGSSLSVMPSREQLSNDSITTATIKKLLQEFIDYYEAIPIPDCHELLKQHVLDNPMSNLPKSGYRDTPINQRAVIKILLDGFPDRDSISRGKLEIEFKAQFYSHYEEFCFDSFKKHSGINLTKIITWVNNYKNKTPSQSAKNFVCKHLFGKAGCGTLTLDNFYWNQGAKGKRPFRDGCVRMLQEHLGAMCHTLLKQVVVTNNYKAVPNMYVGLVYGTGVSKKKQQEALDWFSANGWEVSDLTGYVDPTASVVRIKKPKPKASGYVTAQAIYTGSWEFSKIHREAQMLEPLEREQNPTVFVEYFGTKKTRDHVFRVDHHNINSSVVAEAIKAFSSKLVLSLNPNQTKGLIAKGAVSLVDWVKAFKQDDVTKLQFNTYSATCLREYEYLEKAICQVPEIYDLLYPNRLTDPDMLKYCEIAYYASNSQRYVFGQPPHIVRTNDSILRQISNQFNYIQWSALAPHLTDPIVVSILDQVKTLIETSITE